MQNKRIGWGWVIIVVIAVIPIILWYLAPAYPPRFSGFETTLINMGQIFGLVGAVLLSLNFVLSTRLNILERFFRGLNDVYIKHHLFGKIAFALLLFHPFLLVSKYTSGSLGEVLAFLLPGKDWDVNFGFLALALMTVLIVLTLYLRPRYDYWKITHKFFGLVLILAGFHIWLIPSTVSTYMPLRIYLVTIISLGVVSYIYKTLLGWILIPKILFKLEGVKRLNKNVVELTFSNDKKFNYKSGQYCFIDFDDDVLGSESHPFSFVSAPHEDKIKMAIKNLGDYTSKIGELKAGTIAKAEGPFGMFNYENAFHTKQVWIAGGIGITPFVSMAEDLLHKKSVYNIDLFYAVNKAEDAVYLERLHEIARLIPDKLKVYENYFANTGFLTAEMVNEKANGVSQKAIFVCGPPKMMEMMRVGLVKIGADPNLIKSEEFSL